MSFWLHIWFMESVWSSPPYVFLTVVHRTVSLPRMFHIVFLSCRYSISFPCLFCHLCFLYIVGSNLQSSAIFPCGSMCTLSFISLCKKAPGMSSTTTHLLYSESIMQDWKVASKYTVGELFSFLSACSPWYFLSVHILVLVFPSLFLLETLGSLSSCTCNCFNSLSIPCLMFLQRSKVHFLHVIRLVWRLHVYCLWFLDCS